MQLTKYIINIHIRFTKVHRYFIRYFNTETNSIYPHKKCELRQGAKLRSEVRC